MRDAGLAGATRPAVPKSDVPAVQWLPLPTPPAARYLTILQQLEETQWWPQERLSRYQFLQLEQLLSFAARRIAWWRPRLRAAGFERGRALTPEIWAELPILTRRTVQDAGERLHAQQVPPTHGRTLGDSTSGSTGTPVRLVKSQLWLAYFGTFAIRQALWSGVDLAGKLAVIRKEHGGRPVTPDGYRTDDWVGPVGEVFPTGPLAFLDKNFDTAHQAEWLLGEQPDILLTWPSIARELARHFIDNRLALPSLKTVRTFGEAVSADLRALVREAWGAEINDAYSTQEAGYLALQCPRHRHYHVQSESAKVEILDEQGRECGPGEIGRVIVTPLHNFAMPLIRYDVEDYAEVGEACDCGRGLPVITRIVGRARHMLVLPSGARRFPSFRNAAMAAFDQVRQYQMVQKSLDRIEVQMVAARKLTDDEERRFAHEVCNVLGHKFTVTIAYHAELPRSASGKFEDFRSEVAVAAK